MNGGASGGPIFLELSDDSWVINGVNSIGNSDAQWGTAIAWNQFGSTVSDLYCYVLGAAPGGRACCRRGRWRPATGSRATRAATG